MPTDPASFVEWGRNIGLTGICAGLAWIVRWALGELLKEKDKSIVKLEADLEKVKSQRDVARDQVLAEKDKAQERYHRLATEVSGVVKETGGWLEYFARTEGGGRRGGGRTPAPASRNRPASSEDEGGPGT